MQEVEIFINVSHQQKELIVRGILSQGDDSPTFGIERYYSPSQVYDANNGLVHLFYWQPIFLGLAVICSMDNYILLGLIKCFLSYYGIGLLSL